VLCCPPDPSLAPTNPSPFRRPQRKFIPTVVAAFFKLDMPVLRHYCKDSALAQMRAVAAAREIEGLSMDGTILNVQKVELVQAKALERGLPILLVSSQVQYIHCIRNKKVRRATRCLTALHACLLPCMPCMPSCCIPLCAVTGGLPACVPV